MRCGGFSLANAARFFKNASARRGLREAHALLDFAPKLDHAPAQRQKAAALGRKV
jgi:hypothetical protein